MKNIQLILAAAALVGLSACNKTEQVSLSPVNTLHPVGFGTYVTGTKVLVDPGDVEMDFGVFAYYTQNESWHQAALPDFMYNQKVSGSNLQGFSYSPVKYWPSSDGAKLSFFAYSPYGTVANGISPQTANTDAGAPKIKYAVPSDESGMVDLLCATPVYDATLQQSGGSVQFMFHHRLSRIGFQARLADDGYEGSTIYLNSLSLTANYPVSGVLDLSDGSWSDVTTGREKTVVRSFGTSTGGKVLGTTKQYVNGGQGYLMCIPTGEEKDYMLEVTYTIVTTDPALSGGALVCTNTLTKEISLLTEAGKTYDLCLNIGPTAIDFSQPDVNNWTVGEDEQVTCP